MERKKTWGTREDMGDRHWMRGKEVKNVMVCKGMQSESGEEENAVKQVKET